MYQLDEIVHLFRPGCGTFQVKVYRVPGTGFGSPGAEDRLGRLYTYNGQGQWEDARRDTYEVIPEAQLKRV